MKIDPIKPHIGICVNNVLRVSNKRTFNIVTTNEKGTEIAPAYIIINDEAMNSAPVTINTADTEQ
jgi:hypothetical protein